MIQRHSKSLQAFGRKEMGIDQDVQCCALDSCFANCVPVETSSERPWCSHRNDSLAGASKHEPIKAVFSLSNLLKRRCPFPIVSPGRIGTQVCTVYELFMCCVPLLPVPYRWGLAHNHFWLQVVESTKALSPSEANWSVRRICPSTAVLVSD